MQNEILTDEALGKLLYEYMPKANILLDILEEERDKDKEPHVFSKRYNKNMKKIIKEYSRTPMQEKFATIRKYVATILIIFILVNGILIATAEGYRENFFKIITTVYEKFTSIITEVEDEHFYEELNFIEPTYIPDGFKVVNYIETEITRKIDYRNDYNDIIVFMQGIITSEEIRIDSEGTSIEEMKISNQVVSYVFNKGIYNGFWNDEQYSYSITAMVSYEEFVKIIEGVLNK